MDVAAKRHSLGLEWGKVLTTVFAMDRLLTIAAIGAVVLLTIARLMHLRARSIAPAS